MTDPANEKVMLACGHAANAVYQGPNGEWLPSCAICAGISGGDNMRVVEAPDLTGRRARCGYFKSCGNEVPSALNLWFFEHRPDKDYDSHYCACKGYD